jgi:site-specific DNA recombinase
MNCFLYARKSTDEPDRQMLSIEAQVTELREYAQKERLTIVEEFTESMTARKPGRPIFNAMMDRVTRGEVDALLAWHPDRLGRNPLDGGRLIHALDSEALSTLKFPTFWFENTPQGRFMLAVSFGQAKLYVDDLSVNIRRGIRQKLRRGEFPGKPPVGYANEPRLRTIVIDDEKAPLVRRMFADFATGRFTVKQLRDRVMAWGLLSTRGQRPALSKLYKTLANPFYIGLFRYNGELHDGTHESLISQELFDQVQAILRRRSVPKNRRPEPFHFVGEIRCGECGCSITAERQKTYTYYRCTRKKGHCLMRFSREEAIENQLRQCTELVSLPDGWSENLLAQVAEWKAEAESSSFAGVTDASARLSEVVGKLSRLTDLVADGVISADEYTPRKEALLVKKTQLTDRLASFRRNGDPSLDRLELFLREAQHANDVAVTEKLDDLTAFHRKIGSNFLLFGPERISRGVISGRHPAASDGRSDGADASSPAGKREERDHSFGGDAADARANQVTEVPGNDAFPGPPVTGDESVAGFIPVPFDPNRSRPTSFTKTGKPLRKIRQDGLPILAVKFPGAWRLLATRPAAEKWWSGGDSNSRPPRCERGALPTELPPRL